MTTNNPQQLCFLGPGFNWMKIQGMIAVGVGGYDSPLPPGTKVFVETYDPGKACMEGPLLVGNGTVHTAITTPPWYASMALQGKGYFSTPIPLKALARFPHFDQMAFAVRKELGVKSIPQIFEKKIPLKVSTGSPGHPASWVMDRILDYYGCAIREVEQWGGRVTSEDRQAGRLESLRSGQINAIFDEALMTQRWKVCTDEFDFDFLPLEDAALKHCENLGMKRSVIPKGRLRGVEADVPTVDMAGWLLYCHEALPGELAYHVIKALDSQKKMIESLFQPGQGLTGSLDMKDLCRHTEIPLHPGAARYYQEHGYL